MGVPTVPIMVCMGNYTQAAESKSDKSKKTVNAICGADYHVQTWRWSPPAGFCGRAVEPHVAVYAKDTALPVRLDGRNPHTAEAGCLALFHIWDGDICFDESFRTTFDECVSTAGIANMSDDGMCKEAPVELIEEDKPFEEAPV